MGSTGGVVPVSAVGAGPDSFGEGELSPKPKLSIHQSIYFAFPWSQALKIIVDTNTLFFSLG